MNEEARIVQEGPDRPVVVHPGPTSIEDLLRNIDPAPDEETERFVGAIYAERRGAVAPASPQ